MCTRTLLVAALLLALLGVSSAGAAKNLPGRTYEDAAGGYAITIPDAWKVLPRSKAAIEAVVASLKHAKKGSANAELDAVLSSILASPTAVKGLTAYRFQAIAWPPDAATPILTEVSLGIIKTSIVYARSELTALGDEYANAFSANAGARIDAPRTVKLPAGDAELVEGTIPAGGGVSSGVELYLIPHGKHVFELAFQVDSRLLAGATLFTAIARDFSFLHS